ncbi:transglycosylase SLT domain-containing protein [Candidatus Thiothrix anitrata]|nr:transglycosylase SLT domain-containing protein [Candidatus Thiothrix anitrata]
MSAVRRCATLLLVPAAFAFSSSSAIAACDQYAPQVIRAMAGPYQQVIVSAARANGVNPNLLKAVITAESCFKPAAVSHKGAGGLMQLMPATARRFGVVNRFDTNENIHGGARYLRWLLTRYGGSVPHAVAAYNAGEGRVDRYGTAVPIEETQTYTRRVLNAYQKLSYGQQGGAKPQVVRGAPGSRCEVVTHSLYTIHGNQTLQHVAKRYGMSVKRLAALNKIPRPYKVAHGQRLRVEVCGRWAEGAKSSGSNRAALASKIHERVAKPAEKEKDDRWGFDF